MPALVAMQGEAGVEISHVNPRFRTTGVVRNLGFTWEISTSGDEGRTVTGLDSVST